MADEEKAPTPAPATGEQLVHAAVALAAEDRSRKVPCGAPWGPSRLEDGTLTAGSIVAGVDSGKITCPKCLAAIK